MMGPAGGAGMMGGPQMMGMMGKGGGMMCNPMQMMAQQGAMMGACGKGGSMGPMTGPQMMGMRPGMMMPPQMMAMMGKGGMMGGMPGPMGMMRPTMPMPGGAPMGGAQPGAPQPPQQQQQPQQPAAPSGALTASALAAAPPGAQKQMLGERLYPAISKFQPELAGKITGMMLEMDNSELLIMLESDQQLKMKIDEAMKVLEGNSRP